MDKKFMEMQGNTANNMRNWLQQENSLPSIRDV